MKVLLLITFCLPQLALANQILSAKSSSLGGAGRAAVESMDSLYLNPAGLALLEKYYFGSGFSSGDLVPSSSRETLSLTLADGSPGVALPGSLGYRYHRVGFGESSYREHEFRVGFGKTLWKRLSLGAAYSNIRSESDRDPDYRQQNADAGMLLTLADNLNLSLTAEGLIKQNVDIPEALRRPSRWGVGGQFFYQNILQLRYDVMRPLHEAMNQNYFSHHVGLGIVMRSYFFLNFGFINDDIRGENWYTGGLVWEGPRLKMGYSVQNETRAGLGLRHLVDLWLDI